MVYPFTLAGTFKWCEAIRFGLERLATAKVHPFTLLILNEEPILGPQSYRRIVTHDTITIYSGDDAGFMYALLDLRFQEELESCDRQPHILKRGIKYNIPLDARTPSYSDSSDIAQNTIERIWDLLFWKEYLDTLAEYKYNVLSLWSLSPFPSLVANPEFPMMNLSNVLQSTLTPKPSMSGDTLYIDVMGQRLITIKELTIEEKIAFWNKVMEYAHERCITVYLFTWNLFIFDSNPYGIDSDVTNEQTKAYLKSSIHALLDSYPLLGGFGVTAGEYMSGDGTLDVQYLYAVYAEAIRTYLNKHPQRSFELVHRSHWAAFETIDQLYDTCTFPFALSFKYSNAHLHSSTNPPFLSEFLNDHDLTLPLYLTLRDDDYYLHRWANYKFAHSYINALPSGRIEGFFLGSDGYSWGWETVSLNLEPQLYITKHRAKLALFGELSYNHEFSHSQFIAMMRMLYPQGNDELFYFLEEASDILRFVTMVHWRDWDFQWYIEGCCKYIHPPVGLLEFEDIIDFVFCPAMKGSGVLSIHESCTNPHADGIHPIEIATLLQERSEKILAYTEKQRNEAYDEMWEMVEDIHSLALLGYYYSQKIEAAYRLGRSKITGREDEKIFVLLEKGAKTFKEYANLIHARYRPQRFARLCSYIDIRMFVPNVLNEHRLAREYLNQGGAYGLVE